MSTNRRRANVNRREQNTATPGHPVARQSWCRSVRHRGAMWLGAVLVCASAEPGIAAQSCAGDCDGDGQVVVAELIRGVNIALGNAELAACPAVDRNGDAAVAVSELITAVGSAMDGCGADRLAFVIATDFETGRFGTISLDTPRQVQGIRPEYHVNSDAVARTFDGKIYVVNRLGGDSIQVLDPERDFTTVSNCSTASGSNPQDIVFLDRTKAYVTRYELTELLIVDPSVGADCEGFVLGFVDLSAFADSDGIPEMARMAISNGTLYVSIQRLDRNNWFAPADRGTLAVIDTATDEVTGAIRLSGENPIGNNDLTVEDGAVLVAQSGLFAVDDGGIERVDVRSGEAQGFFVTEADLGGDITDFILVSERLGYAVISGQDFSSSVVAFDPTIPAVTQTLLTGSTFVSDLALNDRGELFVADRHVTLPGVRIFRASDGTELTPEPLDLGLPPFEILFIR